MKTTNHQTILSVEPDDQFRAEVVNFLLSAGYENAEATEGLAYPARAPGGPAVGVPGAPGSYACGEVRCQISNQQENQHVYPSKRRVRARPGLAYK
jgi:hypothetical protein